MDERRNDAEIRVLQNDVTHLSRRFEEGEERAEDWRNSFCKKVDDIHTKLDVLSTQVAKLPCPARAEQYKGVVMQLRALWAVTGGMLIAIIYEWIKIK